MMSGQASQIEEIQRAAVRTTCLWFSVLGGHLAWTVQLLASYFVVSVACLPGAAQLELAGLPVFELLLLLLTLGPAALAIVATLVGFRAWRAAEGDLEGERGGSAGWRGFMGLFGALLSGLFASVILLTGLSYLYLRPCG